MLKSMTGFGSAQGAVAPFGKVTCELRSINHRFLEMLFHLPEGFSYLEEELKKEIEKKIKRGRLTCLIKLSSQAQERPRLNEKLLRNYFFAFEKIRQELKLKEPVSIDALINLPGIVAQEEKAKAENIWPELKKIVVQAVDKICAVRAKEGVALLRDIRQRNNKLKAMLNFIRLRFTRVVKEKAGRIKGLEEKSSFLKSSDISEELTRIQFHLNNFTHKLNKTVPVGKELDFIAQELQRETNTVGAKSIDAVISGRVVAMKSEIEKIREQLQNVE